MTIETWKASLEQQRKLYGAAWVQHLELLNVEIESKNAKTVSPSLIPYFWNDPPVTKTRNDDGKLHYPPISGRASARTAGMLARGWLLEPRKVLPDDHIQVNQAEHPSVTNSLAIRDVLEAVFDKRDRSPRIGDAWDQMHKYMEPVLVDRFKNTLPTPEISTIIQTLASYETEEIREIIPPGSVRSRWMSAGIAPSLAVRVRARALVDAYAFDTLRMADQAWTPRVLLGFPNAPSPDVPDPHPGAAKRTPARWKTAVEHRFERLLLHDGWITQFIDDLISAGLTVEAQIVENLRPKDSEQVRRILQGAPPVSEVADVRFDTEVDDLDELLELRRAVIDLSATDVDALSPSVVFRNAAAIVDDNFKVGLGHAAKCVLDWFNEHPTEADPTDMPTAYTELSVDRRCHTRCLIEGVIWSVIDGFEDGNQSSC